MAADTGTGLSILFATSAFSAEIVAVNSEPITREAIDSSHLLTANNAMTFIFADLYDPGGCELTINWEPDSGNDVIALMTAAAETVTITYKKQSGGASAGQKLAGSAGATEFTPPSVAVNGKMEASFKLKYSGPITFTDEV